MLTVSIHNDDSPESPNEWHGWKFIPFNSRYVGSEPASDYFESINEFGELVPANIGIRRMLDCGTAFAVSCYEHGLVAYSLRGEGMQCRWDTSDVAGILIWEPDAKELPKEYEKRKESARRFIQTYTEWANGEVYGYCIEDEEGEHVDSCCGFFASDTEYMFRDNVIPALDGREFVVDGEASFLEDELRALIDKEQTVKTA